MAAPHDWIPSPYYGQVPTIRTKLLQIGAQIYTSVRRVVLHLLASYPLAELFPQAAATLLRPLPRPSSRSPETRLPRWG